MIQINTIGSFTEIYVGGGNFITQSRPTYFHTFSTQKILAGDEKIEDFMEVTPAQQASIMEHDASFVRPPRLFIDQWNAACGKHGGYNSETGYFELNGLTDITYEEAVKIYRFYSPTGYVRQQYWGAAIRTNIPCFLRDIEHLESAFYASSIEVIRLSRGSWIRGDFTHAFRSCSNLRKILDPQLEFSTNSDRIFEDCGQLEEVRVKFTGKNIYFHQSPKLSLDSLRYLVSCETYIKNFTAHVHPNTYAKLTGDTTNAAAAALTEEELAQWQQLLVDAAEKQITFATT